MEEIKQIIMRNFKCSDNSIIAKFYPVSSVFHPETISVSAFGVEKGFNSRTPIYDMMMMKNIIRKRIINPISLSVVNFRRFGKNFWLIIDISNECENNAMQANESIKGISKLISVIIDRFPPISE